MTSRRKQRIGKTDPFDASALEHELAGKKNRQGRRAASRTAGAAEAASLSRVTGKHYRSRPTGGAA